MVTSTTPPAHDEVESFNDSSSQSTSESDNISISLSIPSEIEVALVDARALGDFELWSYISGVIMSLSSGFIVAFAQEQDAKTKSLMGIVALIFSVMFVGSIVMMLVKRFQMKKKKKVIPINRKK